MNLIFYIMARLLNFERFKIVLHAHKRLSVKILAVSAAPRGTAAVPLHRGAKMPLQANMFCFGFYSMNQNSVSGHVKQEIRKRFPAFLRAFFELSENFEVRP